MNNVLRKIIAVMVALTMSIILISIVFFRNDFSSARKVEKADELSGQRIGVIVAFESDYILSDRSDITLKRYDSLSDLLVALCYKQVDGIALGNQVGNYVIRTTSGISDNAGAIDHDSYAAIMSRKNTELNSQFNDFIKEFRESAEYETFKNRSESDYYFDGNNILEETGTGEIIRVGYCMDYMPVSYLDLVSGNVAGIEPDIIRRFANSYNYQIEWVATTEDILFSQLDNDVLDICVFGYSMVYESEFEENDSFALSEPYLDYDIKCLTVTDYDNLSIVQVVEEDEE